MLKPLRRLLDRRLLDRRRAPRVREIAAAARQAARGAPDMVDASLQALGARTAKVAPALLAAAGAGVAMWWWTSWARGRAESDAAESEERT